MNIDWTTILSIFGIILTIFFGILSYIFYRKGIKKKKLLIISDSTILVSEDLSNYNGLKISYNSEEVKTLTSTTIIVKNIGNDVIEASDITPSDPIIITTTNKFLSTNSDGYKINSSNKKITTSLQKMDDSRLQLSFDFLNPKNELSITLLHNGDILVNGDLKNGSVDKSSKNDNYTPAHKTKYSDNIDTEDISYSKIFYHLMRLLSLIILISVTLFIMLQIAIGKDIDNKTIILLLLPMISFIITRSE